jgi:hypothetical protein
MDLSAATNQPLDVTLEDGRKLQVFAGTVRQMGRVQAWLKTLPPPHARSFDGIKPDMPPQIAKAIAKAVAESARQSTTIWPPEVSSIEGLMAVSTNEAGKVLILKLAFERSWPGMTDADADSLLDRLTWPQFMKIAYHFYGYGDDQVAEKKAGDDDGAEAATKTEKTPTT